MKVKQYFSTGHHDIIEGTYDVPELQPNEVQIHTKYTGVCFSDKEWVKGQFDIFGYHKDFFGHEGLGQVSKVGSEVTDVKIGDYVATWRSSPAFAQVYNSAFYVKVPKVSPRYIAEPLACGINVAMSVTTLNDEPIIIFGSGFLAVVVYNVLKARGTFQNRECFVVGRANKELWKQNGVIRYDTLDDVTTQYKFVNIVDLSEKPEFLTSNLVGENAHYIYAANKAGQIDLSQLLNKGTTITMPSPCSATFKQSMLLAVDESFLTLLNVNGDIDKLWTEKYNANDYDDVCKAFDLDTPTNGRRYIKWF